MLDHVGIKASDLAKARDFYYKALEPLGISILFEEPGAYLGLGDQKPEFWISLAQNGNVSQKLHVAFAAKSQADVDAFYNAALAAGGHDNGAPGPRPDYGPDYYGAFVLDPDGNNVEAMYHS